MLSHYKNISEHKLIKILSIIGMLIACWIMYIQQGWVNDDSVIYFESARLLALAEWKLGMQAFPWPLYSLLIAGLHKLTSLNLQLCAQILNTIFFAITVYSLLKIIQLAGGDKLSLVFAALLLFGTSYIVGDVLPMLLRDQGFWAFSLTALVFFIKFYRDNRLENALYWQAFAALALLFRIETITYIVFLPFTLLAAPDISTSAKLRNLCKAHTLNASITVLAITAVAIHGSVNFSDLGRIQEIFSAFSDIQKNFNLQIISKANVLAKEVLGEPLEKFAWMSLILTFVSISIVKSISVAGWLPPILIWLNYTKIKQKITADVWIILVACGIITLINALLIILKVNLLTSRYVIFFGFIMIILTTFSLRAIYEKWQIQKLNKTNTVVAIITVTLITVGIISNVLPKESGYNYQKEAVDFVKKQNAANKKVFYVSPRARYYAGEAYLDRGYDYWDFTQKAIIDGSIYQYDYLVINLDINEQSLKREKVLEEKLQQYQLIKIIYGYKNKKRMLIYKRVN